MLFNGRMHLLFNMKMHLLPYVAGEATCGDAVFNAATVASQGLGIGHGSGACDHRRGRHECGSRGKRKHMRVSPVKAHACLYPWRKHMHVFLYCVNIDKYMSLSIVLHFGSWNMIHG